MKVSFDQSTFPDGFTLLLDLTVAAAAVTLFAAFTGVVAASAEGLVSAAEEGFVVGLGVAILPAIDLLVETTSAVEVDGVTGRSIRLGSFILRWPLLSEAAFR